MKLLLDLGNTRLKWAFQSVPDAWLASGARAWGPDIERSLADDWAALPRPERIVAASVVDVRREACVEAMSTRLWNTAPRWLRTPARACGVRNAYAEPARLGVDRFLAMVAALADGHAPCILASAGTALALDALAADGRHLGGLIAPGVRLMQQSLADATARIALDRIGAIVDAADNTADAVTSGCHHAAVALIERFAQRMAVRLGAAPTVWLGGGDAAALLPLLALDARENPDAVLRGLAVWAETSAT